MASVTQRLYEKKLINPPLWLPQNVHYETMMGSIAYGCNVDESDIDLYGFAIPMKEMVFPHLAGDIHGFGRQKKNFEVWQEHHVKDAGSQKEYDLSIYNIVKYFSLCMENNPNMVNSLFTPQFCVLHITQVGGMVRENRKLFLHKGCWHKFKGYAYSQIHKLEIKEREEGSKRWELIQKHGYDTKFGYHVPRLLEECRQILVDHDLDLQKNREQLKAIRRGDVPLEDLKRIASDLERELESLYASSSLRMEPDEKAIKKLLLDCLEHHYGSLEKCVTMEDRPMQALREIDSVLNKIRGMMYSG